ncbi:preprotein translocase subunit YajC [Stieleria bergensis]|uniref:Sec translocon accessory complex subunit YajC n=1 Tax=Stieleria bergensis TaxID=2528025 RepID=A0A517SRE3_9BACT|nr:MAG: preprotein translocase subunit YajC [Rhodopirellula sp. TMED11]QDT58663.1 preprotein translocase subunit YajC [Planctomycetes bacterium SV_7m_r]
MISGSFSSVLYRFPIGNLLLIAQEDAGQVAENGGGEVAADAPFWLQMVSQPMFPIGVLLMLFYFLVMAPEKRRRAEEAKRLAGIKKNDPVVTSGGLHGTVVSAPSGSDVITIRLDDKGELKVKVSRWALTSAVDKKKQEPDKQSE